MGYCEFFKEPLQISRMIFSFGGTRIKVRSLAIESTVVYRRHYNSGQVVGNVMKGGRVIFRCV